MPLHAHSTTNGFHLLRITSSAAWATSGFPFCARRLYLLAHRPRHALPASHLGVFLSFCCVALRRATTFATVAIVSPWPAAKPADTSAHSERDWYGFRAGSRFYPATSLSCPLRHRRTNPGTLGPIELKDCRAGEEGSGEVSGRRQPRSACRRVDRRPRRVMNAPTGCWLWGMSRELRSRPEE
jgi:hypothetical protein